MAPKGNNKGPSSTNGSGSRIKFRFVDIEVYNVNESVTEGLKSLASALSRPQQPVVVRTLSSGTSQSGGTSLAEQQDIEEETHQQETGENDVLEGVEDVHGMQEEERPATRDNRPRKFREPQFLHDVDLTSATTPLEVYLEEKSPGNLTDKYLVVAQWYKEFLSTPEVNVDHIFTAFDSLGWRSQIPQDAGSPLRTLKAANMLDSVGRGKYKVSWNGTKAVAGMAATE